MPGFSGSVRYVYDNADAVALVNNSNAIGAIITHGPGVDEPLMIAAGGQKYFLLSDGLGSVIAVADGQGNIVERMQYQAYGKSLHLNPQSGVQTEASQIPGNIYSYTGREYDAETGLFYYRARYYDADAGRFIQKDPIGFNGGDANLYAYVKDNPTNLRDPSGKIWTFVAGAGMGAATGFVGSVVAQSILYHRVNWGDAIGSAITSGAIGAFSPVYATSIVGAGALGAIAGVGQYLSITSGDIMSRD